MSLLSSWVIATALAAPFGTVPVHGTLADGLGAPITGRVSIAFSLVERGDEAALWQETVEVTVDRGTFGVYLGAATPLDLSLFVDHPDLDLVMAVADDPPMAPIAIGWVPRAAESEHARAADLAIRAESAAEADMAQRAATAAEADHASVAEWAPVADLATRAVNADHALDAEHALDADTCDTAHDALLLAGQPASFYALSGARLRGSTLELDEAGGTTEVDLSGLVALAGEAAGAADADGDPLNELLLDVALNGSKLVITDAGQAWEIDLQGLASGFADLDGDPLNEVIADLMFDGAELHVVDSGGSWSVDLSALGDDADADPGNELISGVRFDGTNLEIEEAGAQWSVDLSALADADGDPANERVTELSLQGTMLRLTEAGTSIFADLSGLVDTFIEGDADPSNELLVDVSFDGEILDILDAGGQWSVDLSSLADGDGDPFNETVDDVAFDGSTLTITEAGHAFVADLTSLLDAYVEADGDPTNELQQATRAGATVTLSQGGGSFSVNDADASPDNELVSGFDLRGSVLSLVEAGRTYTVDFSGMIASIAEVDGDVSNEIIDSLALDGTTLTIVEAGRTLSADLSALVDAFVEVDGDVTNEIQAVSRAGSTVTLSRGGGSFSVDDADANMSNELITGASLVGSELRIVEAGRTWTTNLAGLIPSFIEVDGDVTNEIQAVSRAGSTVTLSRGGGSFSVDDADANAGNELITGASLVGSELRIVEAGQTWTANLAGLIPSFIEVDGSVTNELQTVSRTGSTVTLSNGGGSFSVDDADASATNELQTIARTGSTVTLSNGGGSFSIDDGDASATNEQISAIALQGTTLRITEGAQTWTGDLSGLFGSFVEVDGSVTNELQTISRSGSNLVLSGGGGTVSIEDGDANPSNELQVLTRSGSTITLSGSGGSVSVDDADASATNELQTISRSGATVTLSGGGGSFSVDDADASTTNETITGVSVVSGNTLRITEAGVNRDVALPLNQATVRYQRDDAAETTQTRTLSPYHLSITTVYAGKTKAIPQSVINEYCGDPEGCEIRIGMTRWSSVSQTEAASRSYTFYYSIADGRWRASNDNDGVDGSGGIQHVINIWDTCYFTDGNYDAYAQQGDLGVGMQLLLWNGYGGANRTCELTFID